MNDDKAFLADMLEKLNRLWNNGEVSVAAEILTPDFERQEPGAELLQGPQALQEYVLNLRDRFPDLIITFEENIFDGQTMVTRWRFKGTDLGRDAASQIEPTGKNIDYKGVDVLHIKDGKIDKDFAYFDQVTILQQLGMMPEQSM